MAVRAAVGGLPADRRHGDRDAISPPFRSGSRPPSALPTATDIGARRAPALTDPEIEARVPLPEAADLPPPSLPDVGGPPPAPSRTRRGKRSTKGTAPHGHSGSAAAPAHRARPSAPPRRSRQRTVAGPAAPPVEDPIVAAMRDLRRHQARPPDRAQERALGGRSVLCQARIRAAVDRERRGLGARQGGDQLSRRRWIPKASIPPTTRRRCSGAGAEPAALAEADVR